MTITKRFPAVGFTKNLPNLGLIFGLAHLVELKMADDETDVKGTHCLGSDDLVYKKRLL